MQVHEYGRGLNSTFFPPLKHLERVQILPLSKLYVCYKMCTIDAFKDKCGWFIEFRSCTKDIKIIQVLYVHDLNKHMTAFII